MDRFTVYVSDYPDAEKPIVVCEYQGKTSTTYTIEEAKELVIKLMKAINEYKEGIE